MRRFPDTSWDPSRPDAADLLARAEVTDSAMIPSSSNYVFLLELRAPEVDEPGYAVYKPEKGETPLWDFPPSLYKREIATWLVSEALGWRLVPPTVAREAGLEHGLGSLQLFIAGDHSCTYFDLRDQLPDVMRRFAAFDWLTNNADRKGGHILRGTDGQVWGIDHGLTFHVDEKLRTVIWDYAGERLPDPWVADIAALCDRLDDDRALIDALRGCLSARELEVLRQRAGEIVAEPVLPNPPDWRRPYPWPLV